jgi:hypothetical protein
LTLFKFQYWLPVAMPLFSSLVILLPEKEQLKVHNKSLFKRKWFTFSIRAVLLVFLVVQFVLYIIADIQLYRSDLHRAENNPRIEFYSQAVDSLIPLAQESLKVYYDYRLYVPSTSGWTTATTYDLLDYGYVRESNFSVLLLLEQRIRDYLNPNVQGIDTVVFANNQQFYADAEAGKIQGYSLLYRNHVGLIYVREDLYQKYFFK